MIQVTSGGTHWKTKEPLIRIYVDGGRHQQYSQEEYLTVPQARDLINSLEEALEETADTTGSMKLTDEQLQIWGYMASGWLKEGSRLAAISQENAIVAMTAMYQMGFNDAMESITSSASELLDENRNMLDGILKKIRQETAD